MISPIHLTEEQLLNLLDQHEATGTQQGHLASCADCRTELAGLRDSLANFRHAMTGMALAQRPSRPIPQVKRSDVHWYDARRYVWSASFATAMVLAGTALSVMRPWHQTAPAPPSNVTAAMPVGESDEALLEGIQRDLSTSIPPSLEPLAVPAAAGATPNSTKN